MYPPFAIGARFRVVPPGAAPAADGRIDLVMARGAFGSGEHETTASCLEILEELRPTVRGARVLDLGSGTGILAVAALRLGAARAVCVDLDPRAVQAARRSCDLNGLAGRVEHVTGSLGDVRETDFDLVLANLYGDVLLALGRDLAARARPGAALVLSGIAWEYAYDVRRLFEQSGCTVERSRMLEDYWTFLLRRTGR